MVLPAAAARQGITVVSDHRSTVLTYIGVDSMWIQHAISGTELCGCLALTLFCAAKVVHLANITQAGWAAKHAVTRMIGVSVTQSKGPLPGSPSF